MGVSENRGPQYSTLKSRILIIRTPNKVTLMFEKSLNPKPKTLTPQPETQCTDGLGSKDIRGPAGTADVEDAILLRFGVWGSYTLNHNTLHPED